MRNKIKKTAGAIFRILLHLAFYCALQIGVVAAFAANELPDTGFRGALLYISIVFRRTPGWYIMIASAVYLFAMTVYFRIRDKRLVEEATICFDVSRRDFQSAIVITPILYGVIDLLTCLAPSNNLFRQTSYNCLYLSSNLHAVDAFAIVIIVPIVEQITLSGLALSRMQRIVHPKLALVILSSVFALTHHGLLWVVCGFLVSSYFIWVAQKTGSILPSIVSQAVFHLLGVIGLWFKSSVHSLGFEIFIDIWLIAIGLCLYVIALGRNNYLYD